MAEILSNFVPLHLGNVDNILVYEDTVNNCYVIRDKNSGDLLIKMPKEFPPKG